MFVMARPNSERCESSRKPQLFMLPTPRLPMKSYIVISAEPGIEIAQQYDFVVSRNPSEGGIQRYIKSDEFNVCE